MSDEIELVYFGVQGEYLVIRVSSKSKVAHFYPEYFFEYLVLSGRIRLIIRAFLQTEEPTMQLSKINSKKKLTVDSKIIHEFS